MTVYIVRAYSLPQSAFEELAGNELETDMLRQWYELFEDTFGVSACSYNPHVFSHLNEVHAVAPLWELTATDFEDQYAVIKKNYRPGTTAMGNQALTTGNLAHMTGHRCTKKKELTLTNTKSVDDRYVYLKDGRILCLTDLEDNVVRGRVVPNQPARGLLRGVDFGEVLCFRVEPDALEDEVVAKPSDVAGKCVILLGYCSVMTWDMLRL